MRKNIISGLFLLLISAGAAAQDFGFPELEGFKKITKYPVYSPSNLWDFINGAADTYLALGFVDLHVAEYKKGKEVIKLEIYKHSDQTMAFGIYASERSPSFRYLNLGSQGYSVDGMVNFFKGNYYVKIRTYSGKIKVLRAAETLAMKVAAMLEGTTDMPAMLSLFPADGRKANEETYINESVLGHEFLNKAFKAEYSVGSDNFSIFIIKYGSPIEAVQTTVKYLKAAGVDELMIDEGKLVFNDGYNGNVFLSVKDDKLVIISGLAKDQAEIAEKYTSEILR